MKKLLFILAAFAFISAASAQTVRYKAVNLNENSVSYYTTTDSTLAAKQTVTIADSSVGILEVTVIGFSDSLGVGITGKQIVRYKKANGTLTLGTPSDVLAKATDSGLGTATWDISTASNNVTVRLKGKLNYTVYWRVVVTRRSIYKL